MCDLLSRVQTLWAGTSAVQYGMAAIELELIIYRIQSLLCIFVTTITYPPIGVEQGGGAQIRLRVPPVAGAGCATAGTQYALVHPIQLSPILLALANLFPGLSRRALPLQPRLYALVLIVEVGHVHHQVLYHKHVRQRRYRRRSDGRRRRYLRQASEPVAAVDVHGAGAADPFAARSTEGEGGVHLVLDLNEGVEHHGPTLLEVDLVLTELRLLRVFWVPPVD